MSDIFDESEVVILDPLEFWRDFFENKFSSEIRKFSRKYPSEKSLSIPLSSVVEFGKNGITYADKLISEPERSIADIIDAITHYKLIQKKGDVIVPNIRFTNFERKTSVRDLRGPIHVGTLISVEGTIRKTASRKERLVEGVFRCNRGHRTVKRQPYSMKEVPTECSADGCKSKPTELIESASTFKDSQKALLQEYFELVAPGSQPETIEIELTEDLIDTVYAGNRVIINGVLKRYQTASSKTSTVYKNYIEVISVEVTEKEYAEINITAEDEEKIKELASDPEIYNRLTNSVVPTIFGLENVKRAAMYAFFGGLSTESTNGVKTRGDIHILLIGEPGIAKTDFMRKVMAYSPRGVYTSGKGSSGVGLVATVSKDEFGDGSYILDAGAMALADRGMCIIDEINQIEKKDLSLLYEALESQQASINKANIHQTIPTRCSVIAAANPKHGWIDDFMPLKDQIELPGPFLQRFDLIYILRDDVDLNKDSHIIKHIIANRAGTASKTLAPDIEESMFRKYVAYAKQQPLKYSKDAIDAIQGYYLKVRSTRENKKNGSNGNKPVPITPRQGNTLARLAEASARIRLSPSVDKFDVDNGIVILDECLRSIAYDPETGTFDAGAMAVGETKKQGGIKEAVVRYVRDYSDDTGRIPEAVVIENLESKYDKIEIEKIIDAACQNGDLMRPKNGWLKAVNR